jgi:membrane dipeptidase
MTDDMLRAVARNGGVVMVNFYSAFLSEDYRKAWEAQAPERKKAEQAVIEKAKQEGKQPEYAEIHAVDLQFAAKIPRPPFSILIDHIDHIAKVAGVDHVGLGSDFDGITSMPEGMDSAADLPKITEALMARGYSAADMHKILGGNLLRVFGEVEQVSHQLQSSNATARPRLSDKQPFDKPAKK